MPHAIPQTHSASYPHRIFSYTTGVNDSLMVKKTKLSTLQKFGSLRGSTWASLNIGGNLAIREKLKRLKFP